MKTVTPSECQMSCFIFLFLLSDRFTVKPNRKRVATSVKMQALHGPIRQASNTAVYSLQEAAVHTDGNANIYIPYQIQQQPYLTVLRTVSQETNLLIIEMTWAVWVALIGRTGLSTLGE